MERSSSKLWVEICLSVAAVFVCWYALTRDIRYSREYMGDLRNRIVGARIIRDGGSPYFYKYSPGDPIDYYDPQAFDTHAASISTSTPFLHRLLIPLAHWPYVTIMRVWMAVLYVLFLGMTGYAFGLARAPSGRLAVVVVAGLFLLTNAWELHAKYGQTYLLIPALAMLTFALRRWPFLAGLSAAALVMVRPNAVLFLVPFVLMRGFRWAWVLPGFVALGWILISPRERSLWGDYTAMLDEQVKIHQDLGARQRPIRVDPVIREWEGLNMDTVRARIGRDPVRIYSENGNLFVLYRQLVGRPMPIALLAVLGAAAIGVVIWVFPKVRRRYGDGGPERLAIIGFCLYMISDLFSPIYRHAYYGVQWIMPLLLAASLYRGRNNWVYGGLLICLLLNEVHLPFLRMSNTIGEYGFLIGLLIIGFAQEVENLRAPAY
jgi:hypothetical protein